MAVFGFKMLNKSFLFQKVCFRLVSKSFFNRFLNPHFDVRVFQIVVFALDVLQKSTFHGNRF